MTTIAMPGMIAAQGPDSLIWWDWVGRHGDEILHKTLEHIYLTAVAVGIGLILAVMLSVCALRFN